MIYVIHLWSLLVIILYSSHVLFLFPFCFKLTFSLIYVFFTWWSVFSTQLRYWSPLTDFALLLSQVVLWDISAHVTHLQGTQPTGKKVSVNTDTFVSTHILSLTCTIIQLYMMFYISVGVLNLVSVTLNIWLVMMSVWFIQVGVLSLSKHATYLL